MNSTYVASESEKGMFYKVTQNDNGSWSCTCRDFRYRRINCKHIIKCKPRLVCPSCNSSEVIVTDMGAWKCMNVKCKVREFYER